MITKETLDRVKEETVNVDTDTSGLLIELEGAVLDEIGGARFIPWTI